MKMLEVTELLDEADFCPAYMHTLIMVLGFLASKFDSEKAKQIAAAIIQNSNDMYNNPLAMITIAKFAEDLNASTAVGSQTEPSE